MLSKASWHLRYGRGEQAMSRLRRFVVESTHRHCNVDFHGPVTIGPGFRLDIRGRGSFVVGPDVEFRKNFTCEIGGRGRVAIGARTAFTYDTLIQISTSLDIGEDCMIGRALFGDGFHHYRDPHVSVQDQGFHHQPLAIGDGTMITTNAVVLASVGRRALIGANSVVTKPVPDYCVAVGAPARIVDRFAPDGYPEDLVSPPGCG